MMLIMFLPLDAWELLNSLAELLGSDDSGPGSQGGPAVAGGESIIVLIRSGKVKQNTGEWQRVSLCRRSSLRAGRYVGCSKPVHPKQASWSVYFAPITQDD